MLKRFGSRRRTKLSQTRLSKLRGSNVNQFFHLNSKTRTPPGHIELVRRADRHIHDLINADAPLEATDRAQKRSTSIDGLYPLQTKVRLRLNLKKPAQLKKYLELIKQKTPADSIWGDLLAIAQQTKPIFRKGHIVFISDFGQYPRLSDSLGRIGWKMIFVDSQIPEKFRNFVMDHEIRENILNLAGYATMGKYLRGHAEAVKREKRDLEKTGLLGEFLQWLKENHPEPYEQRYRTWNNTKK